jgi:endonuclease/exonuclease/phosphatase (EEP) superfamily protein YafD
LAALLAIAAFWKRRWICGAAVTAVLLYHGAKLAPLYASRPNPPSGHAADGSRATFSIVSANLYAANRRKDEAVAQLAALDPDILIVMEISEAWRRPLDGMLAKYPHRVGTETDLWLLSRFPLAEARIATLPEDGVGQDDRADWGLHTMITATVNIAGRTLRLVVVHPPTPRSAGRIAQQRFEAGNYAAALASSSPVGGRMLIGDFNTTIFSPVFSHIEKTSGLSHAGRGFGYHPTWGPRVPREPLLPWLGVPIDHAFISPELFVRQYAVEPLPGSDHRSLRLEVEF